MDPEPLPDVIETLTVNPTVVRVIPRHAGAGLLGERARVWQFRNPMVATVRQVHTTTGLETYSGRTHLVSSVDQVLITLEEGVGRRGLLDALDPFAQFSALAHVLGRDEGAAVELWAPAPGGGWDFVFVPWWVAEEEAVPVLVPLDGPEDAGVIEGKARRGGRTSWILPAASDGFPVPVTRFTWMVAYRAEADAVPPPRSLAP